MFRQIDHYTIIIFSPLEKIAAQVIGQNIQISKNDQAQFLVYDINIQYVTKKFYGFMLIFSYKNSIFIMNDKHI